MAAGNRSVALDALRGVAILSVLLFHFSLPTDVAWLDLLLRPVTVAGWAGVDLFFVLSGYLVGGIILREVDASGRFDAGRFLVRRAFRLWPILYLYLALLAFGGISRRGIWPAVFHVQNYSYFTPSHLWSLAVEEHFYLGAAIALPWLARRGPRALVAGLIAVIAAATVSRCTALALGELPLHAQWRTPYRIDAPAVGVLLAAIERSWPAWFAAVARRRVGLAAIALAGFGGLASGPNDVVRWGPGLTVAWIASAALVLLAIGARSSGGTGTRWRALAALGRISYPVYVWHAGLGPALAEMVGGAVALSPAAIVAVRVIGVIAVGWALHRAVERPFLAVRDTLAHRRVPVRHSVAAA